MRAGWISVLVLMACGPSSGDDGTLETTSASTAPTGAASCMDYDDTPDIGPAVTVAVRHDGTAPVYYAPVGCGGSLAFSITDAGGAMVPHLVDTECFPNTCEGFVEAAECSVGCNDCAPPTGGRMEPGAMTQETWTGTWLAQLPLQMECVTELGPCPSTCMRRDQAPAGTYTIELTVWRECTGTCECDGGPVPSGLCGLWTGDEQLTEPATFSVTVDYPAQTSVEIVITD